MSDAGMRRSSTDTRCGSAESMINGINHPSQPPTRHGVNLSPKWGRWTWVGQVNGYLDLNPTSPGGQGDTSDAMPWGSGGGVSGVRPLIC